MKIAVLGTRGIPNDYGGFEQCAENLSVGLVKKGHEVTVYNPSFHPFKKEFYKKVRIIRIFSPQHLIGRSASNFVYDYLCFKDATKKDFDIILELGLITSSISIVFCRHKGKKVVTNLDGLEWKRSKWSYLIQLITKQLERFGVKFSNHLIADNIGIQKYLMHKYNRKAKFITYGTSMMKIPNQIFLTDYGLEKNNYLLSIARLEPENNLEMMFDAYIESNLNIPYVVVGNHLTSYGDFLKDKYRKNNITFLGGIFDKEVLDNFRYYSRYYLHGHSVGGTNPSLLEAMAASSFILAHNNQFNKHVVENGAYYFSNKEELSLLFSNNNILDNKESNIKTNLKKIKISYSWITMINQYESYFEDILEIP